MRLVDIIAANKPESEQADPFEIIQNNHPFQTKSFGRVLLTIVIGIVYISFVYLLLTLLSDLINDASWFRYVLLMPILPVIGYFLALDTFFGSLVGLLPQFLTSFFAILFVISLPIVYFGYIYFVFTLINYLRFKSEKGETGISIKIK